VDTSLTPLEKGNALESAVRAIEDTILRKSPALRENTYVIETKKIVTANGVHHEIDIFVTIDLGGGYKSIFIFECKNWQEAVGKNEIIVFSEKVDAVQAQGGFFVAKSFTADAQAQAKKNPRITLLIAKEHEPSGTPVPFDLHFVLQGKATAEVKFVVWNPANLQTLELDLDVKKAQATLSGNDINLEQYINKWVEDTRNENVSRFPSGTLPAGEYEREADATREFSEGELILNGTVIRRSTLHLSMKLSVFRPPVVSHFEVETRGRVLSLAPVDIGGGNKVQLKLIASR
jgi:hypothetical protein